MDEDGACEDCAMQRQHWYDMKRFLVFVASDDFRDNLRIQREIGSHLRNIISLSEPVNLEPPNGRVYPIEAKGEFGQIVFRDGWKEFVSANNIEENDSILFVYRGSSRFKIIELSTSDDDGFMREGARLSCRAQKRTRSCAKTLEKIASTSSPSTKSGYGARKAQNPASVKPEPLSSNLRGSFRRPYILARHTTLPVQMKRKVEKKVQAIGSELPIFVKAMTTTNIDGGGKSLGEVLFGMVYASACLPDKTQPLRLQLEGRKKQWPAMLTVTCRNQRRVYDGWKEFARDNKLKPGDICLFEVSSRNSRSLTMTVHLVR
ncbi:hypothetical protein ACQ4PT_012258 [Festuca glaucescens]